MSYILEALKKSDQQRQRGATPTLQAAQLTVAAPKRPSSIHYGLLAAVLLGAGIVIGWLRPWQSEQPPLETEPITAEPANLISNKAAQTSLPVPSEIARKTGQELPAPKSISAAQPDPRHDAIKPAIATPAAAAAPVPEKNKPEKPGSPAVAQEQSVIPMAELPLQIQQELPAMAVQLHAYSKDPGERLVNINFRSLREGAYVTPDLKLEQITPDGMIFNYKGYRFQRGIR